MNPLRFLLAIGAAHVGALGLAAPGNPFFAMDTIAKGPPEVVVPLLRELGYAGLGGAAGDHAMASALEKDGMTFFNGYLTLQLHAEQPALDDKLRRQLDAMQGHRTALWLAASKVLKEGRPLAQGAAEGDTIVAVQLKAIADYATARGVKVALYPHVNQWFERFEDTIRLAERLNHPAVGVTFNLCHWLKVEGAERDPAPLLRAAFPRLMFVSINGADAGDTRTMKWDRLIQPLGEGSYDVSALLRTLREIGYAGPIGFQGYGIKAPPREVLAKTMSAWKHLQAGLAPTVPTR